MEELAPLVTKVCVLQQKAPQEMSKEKRHLLDLLDRRHRRYVEKKSCEVLELDTTQQSGDQQEDEGLDKGTHTNRHPPSSYTYSPEHFNLTKWEVLWLVLTTGLFFGFTTPMSTYCLRENTQWIVCVCMCVCVCL